MEPERLKEAYGDNMLFWGAGVDTQKILPFGTPEEVREQVLKRCGIFKRRRFYLWSHPLHPVQHAA